MTSITKTAFDYAELPADTTHALRASVTAIRAIQRSAIADVGEHLIKAKALLGHGVFTAWAEAELRMTLRTAERYMTAARFLAGKPDTVSCLPQALVYKLAAPTTPASFVEGIVASAERGALPAAREVGRKLAEAMRLERSVKAEAAKSPEQVKRERDNAKRRLAAEKARQLQRHAEQAAHQATREARAHEAAVYLVTRLGAAGVVNLFGLMHGTDWYLVERQFTGTGLHSAQTLSAEKIEAKFGGMAV